MKERSMPGLLIKEEVKPGDYIEKSIDRELNRLEKTMDYFEQVQAMMEPYVERDPRGEVKLRAVYNGKTIAVAAADKMDLELARVRNVSEKCE